MPPALRKKRQNSEARKKSLEEKVLLENFPIFVSIRKTDYVTRPARNNDSVEVENRIRLDDVASLTIECRLRQSMCVT